MPFVRTRGERVVKPYSDPIALPFTLTPRERAFADALYAASTIEELTAAYRDHLGPIYSQQMVRGYVEIGEQVGEAAIEAVIADKPDSQVFSTPMVTPEYGTVRKAIDLNYLFDLAHEDGITYSIDRVGHLIVNSTTGLRRPIREDIAWMLGGDPGTRRAGLDRPPNVRDLAEPPGSSPESAGSGMFYEAVSAIPLPTRIRLGIEAETRRLRIEFDRRFGGVEGVEAERMAALRAYETRRAALYRDAYTHRSRLIARTEVQFAQNFGRYNGWQQAIDDGLIDVEKAGKQWKIGPELSRRGKRVCPTCRPLSGVIVRINEPFDTLHGPVMMPPMHPACRCTAVLIPDIEAAGFGDRVGPYRSTEARGYDLSGIPEPTAITDPGVNPYTGALGARWADSAREVVRRKGGSVLPWKLENGTLNPGNADLRGEIKRSINEELIMRIDQLAQSDPALRRQIIDWRLQFGDAELAEEELYQMHLRDLTREYVDTWAQSASSPRAKRSWNLQREAEKLFGVRSSTFEEFSGIRYADRPPIPNHPEEGVWADFFRGNGEQWIDIRDNEGLFARAFLRSQYDMTQEMLTQAGVPPGGKVWLYRGVHMPEQNVPIGTQVKVEHINPLSSWTWHPRVALDFSSSMEGGRVFVAAIPRERIIGSSISGIGCFNEAEVVVAFPEGSYARSVWPKAYSRGVLNPGEDPTRDWLYPRDLFDLPPLDAMFYNEWDPTDAFN